MSANVSPIARLEAEAFKKKIVDALKENKIQDSLKSVVRLKLVEKIGTDPAAKSLMHQKLANLTLSDKIVCSLIKSFLHSRELLMSESVFDSEAGDAAILDDLQAFELLCKQRSIVKEVIQCGGYSLQQIPNIKAQSTHSNCLLSALITGILKERMQTYESSTQTVNASNDMDLEQRLQLVEDIHRGNVQNSRHMMVENIENRVREIKQQLTLEKELELKRIRDIEAAQIRAAESAKWREKYQADLDSFEQAYHAKVAALRDREIKALEALTDKAKKLDVENLSKIHTISKQAEYFEKDNDLKRSEMDLLKNELDRIALQLKQKDSELKRREDDLSAKEVTFEQRLKNEVDIYKAVTLREISEKKDQIDTKLAKLNEELDNLAEMRRRMDQLTEKNLKLQNNLDQERNKFDAVAEEKKLVARERDEIKEHLGIMSSNMRRLETEFERSNSKIQTFSGENQHLKDLNSQLRDLLNTYNNEGKKLRADFERREEEYEKKIADLNKALLLQEKRMVDKVIESIDFKHNAYLGRTEESEFIGRLDRDFEAMRVKRREIQEKLDKDEKKQPEQKPTTPAAQSPQFPPAGSTPINAPKVDIPVIPVREAAPPKRVSYNEFDDLDF